ncbi:hypothetical protein BH23GEM4_BH23GEM4_00440 [soil metagenome]
MTVLDPFTEYPEEKPDRVPEWAETLVVGFVVVSLLALVAVPILVQSRIHALRQTVEDVAEPARSAVSRIHFHLAREMSASRGYVLTGETRFLDRYESSLVQEGEAYDELAPLAARLGPEVVELFADVQVLSERWHRTSDSGRARDRLLEEGTVPFSAYEQQLFEQTLQGATRLDQAIVAETRRYRAEIRAAERTGLVLTAVLAALALISALVFSWFRQRVRVLAAEAERRHGEAVRTLGQMRRMVEARDRLVRGVTHDVKNPLGAADGYADLLEMGIKGTLHPEQAQLVAGVRRSIRSALDIVEDLLNLSRAESGVLQIDRTAIDLKSLASYAVSDHAGAAEAAGHRLTVNTRNESTTVYTDPARVRQIVSNLVSNAIKYTPAPGRIDVCVGLAAVGSAPAYGSWAEIRVKDNGPGIPEDMRETVFLEFQRLDPDGTEGHGLGLAISRRIAHLLGGEISVDSVVDVGSVFTLWLPLRNDSERAAEVEDSPR